MPTPKKGRRLGGSSSHQRSMMANLAASLFAAEAIETTEAKAKALRPYAEKLITNPIISSYCFCNLLNISTSSFTKG